MELPADDEVVGEIAPTRPHPGVTPVGGWVVRGRFELGAEDKIVLVVDEQSRATVRIDPAGRGWHADSLVQVDRMRVTSGGEQTSVTGRILAAAIRATPHPDATPRLLRFLLEVIGSARPLDGQDDVGDVDVTLEPRFGPPLPRAGEHSLPSVPADRGDGVWRAPVDDAVLLEGDELALLRRSDVQVLDAKRSRVWREACGVTYDELAEKTDLPADVLRRIVQDMRAEGLLASEPSWYIRDVAARTADGGGYIVVATDRGGPPLALTGSGGTIWKALEESGRPIAASSVVDLVRESEGVQDDIADDVFAFLRSLALAGVVGC